MNKKIFAITAFSLLTILSTSASAKDSFAEVAVGEVKSGDNKIFGKQPLSELLGSDATYYELKYGLASTTNNIGVRAFGFADIAPDKNNEVLFGIGGDIKGHPEMLGGKIGLKLGAKVGYGWQAVKGKTVSTSTNLNKVSYIVQQNQALTPTTAKFEEDTPFISVGLETGLSYEVVKNFTLNADVTYRYDTYQLSYRNADAPIVLNQMTARQDNYAMQIGLEYKF